MPAVALLAAALLPTPASAQHVSFDEALAVGERSPTVEAPRRELEARRAGDDGIGGTATSSNLTFMPGAVVAPDQDQGFESQLSFTQGWNLSDLGGTRRRAAAAEREVLSAEVRADALRVRLEAARRWIDLATLQAVEEIHLEHRTVALARVERAERALAAGVGGAAELAEARAEQADLEQHRLDLEGDRFLASVQLAVAMGRHPSERLRATGALPAPTLPSASEIRARAREIDALPDVAVRRLAASAAREREIEASAQYAPVLSVGAQLERSAAGAWVLYGIVGMTFNAFGQDRRPTSVAHASAERQEAEIVVTRVRVAGEVEDAIHEVEHTRRQLRALEETLVPALTDLRQRRERALTAGEETIFAVLDARRRLLVAREEATRARGARAWAEVRLWLLLAEIARGVDA
jgi:outer membrane protein TolC